MKTILLKILLLISISNWGFHVKNEDENPPEFSFQQKDKLLFRSQIGTQDLQTEVFVYKSKNEKNQPELLITMVKEGKAISSETLSIEMEEEPFIELRKINDDQVDDLAIEYLRPGRGGNTISMIYLFDKENLCFKKISNSISFPNLTYNPHLGVTSSFRFYGGDAVQIDFLKIENDSLVSKYEVIREVQKVYLSKFVNGKWIKMGERLVDKDVIIPEVVQLEPEIKLKDTL